MEDINEKAVQDELNKSEEEIHETPRHRIPVPKVNKIKMRRMEYEKQEN